jgi:DNA-binding HxlR family transcriptional regulator
MTTTAPPALAWSTAGCQIEGTLAIIGEKGAMVVLREVFNGVRRFGDMQRHSGLPKQVLSNRLGSLVEHGILRREPYRTEGERERHEYRLTEKGLDLYPIFAAFAAWGDRYVSGRGGSPVELAHRGCGARVGVVLECEHGHRLDDNRDVAPRPGPAAVRL